jgi:hypothetical protein
MRGRDTYTTLHKRLAGLDVSGKLALVGNGIGVLAHDGMCMDISVSGIR